MRIYLIKGISHLNYTEKKKEEYIYFAPSSVKKSQQKKKGKKKKKLIGQPNYAASPLCCLVVDFVMDFIWRKHIFVLELCVTLFTNRTRALLESVLNY